MAMDFVLDISLALLLNGTEGADLLADGAPVAVLGGNGHAVFTHRQGGAGGLVDAHLAAAALVGVDAAVLALAVGDNALEQGAGLAHDDHKQVLGLIGLLHHGGGGLQVIGVHGAHVLRLHAAAQHQGLDVHGGGNVLHQGHAGDGVVLVAGHAGGAVVQDEDAGLCAVIHGVDQARNAGVEEGGVADKGEHLQTPLGKALHPLEAVTGGDAAAHVDLGVGHAEGRVDVQGIAADVAGGHDLAVILADLVIDAPVRTACAEAGRTHRRLNGSLIGGADAGQAQSPPDDVGGGKRALPHRKRHIAPRLAHIRRMEQIQQIAGDGLDAHAPQDAGKVQVA